MAKFTLRDENGDPINLSTSKRAGSGSWPLTRIPPETHTLVNTIRAATGLPLGVIIAQCVTYALSNMDDWTLD